LGFRIATMWRFVVILAVLIGVVLVALPQPLPVHLDRLSVVNYTTIDNQVYDTEGFQWLGTQGKLLGSTNAVRIPYFTEVMTGFGTGPYLEVGCGGGLVSQALAEAGFNMTGLDMSVRSLNVAREQAKASSVPSDMLRYIEGSAFELPFPDGHFTGVVVADVLEHFTDLRLVRNEIDRVVKPGGVVVFDTIARTLFSAIGIWGVAQEVLNIIPRSSHDWRLFIQPSELEALFGELDYKMDTTQWYGIEPTPGVQQVIEAAKQLSIVPLIATFSRTKNFMSSYMGHAVKPGSG